MELSPGTREKLCELRGVVATLNAAAYGTAECCEAPPAVYPYIYLRQLIGNALSGGLVPKRVTRIQLRAAGKLAVDVFGTSNEFARYAYELRRDVSAEIDLIRDTIEAMVEFGENAGLLQFGTRSDGEGGWTHWRLYARDHHTDPEWDEIHYCADSTYGGPGRPFTHGSHVRMGQFHVLVTQSGGLDV